MAAKTLPLVPTPAFPQVFSQATAVVYSTVRRFPDAPIYCERELPEYGGELCHRIASVCEVETELSLCMGCFRG
jgi:hypothetical protein